jgi:hypothetical protein
MKIQDSRNTHGIKITGTSFFPKKRRLRQCITHTHGIKIPGTSFFQKKKRLRQCITHTQGIKIPDQPQSGDVSVSNREDVLYFMF